MPNQIVYRTGNKFHFVSTRPFALGTTGVTITKGSDVFFDGQTVEVSGAEYSLPQLRGAVRSGWLVLAEVYDADDTSAERPMPAGVQVRHAANGGNPLKPNRVASQVMTTTENDEREVGNTRQHAARTKERNANYKAGQRSAVSSFSEVEAQDGVPVRSLKTVAGEKAKQSRTVLTGSNTGQVMAEAESVQIDPGQGVTEGEMLERMSASDQEEYQARKEAERSKYVVDSPETRSVVGRVKKSTESKTREGITATVSTGGGIEVYDPSGLGGKAKESVVAEEGLTFRNTNGPDSSLKTQPHPRSVEAQQPVMVKDGTADVRRKIAQAVCSDFPTTYQFDQPIRKKLARLQADFDNRPDVIRAVFAAESDDVKAALVQEFPEAFAG